MIYPHIRCINRQRNAGHGKEHQSKQQGSNRSHPAVEKQKEQDCRRCIFIYPQEDDLPKRTVLETEIAHDCSNHKICRDDDEASSPVGGCYKIYDQDCRPKVSPCENNKTPGRKRNPRCSKEYNHQKTGKTKSAKNVDSSSLPALDEQMPVQG